MQKTLAFIGNSEPPDKLLNMFKRQTPGNLGIWGQLKGVGSYEEADYFGVIDALPQRLKHLESRCVFLGAHPPESHYAYVDMSKFKGIRMYDCRNVYGFGEWWLKYDYDYLTNLQPPMKTKDLVCIVSNANTQDYHRKRRIFLEKFCTNHKLDIYGRIKPWGPLMANYKGICGNRNDSAEYNNDHMSGKEEIYASYKYALEFDAVGEHYFSERVYDSLLMWCMPIYWGGRSLHKYIPEQSFSYLTIEEGGEDIQDIISAGTYEVSLKYIAEARDLLLNRWQMWPRIHEAIFSTPK